MREPFGLSRGVQTDAPTIVVNLFDEEGHRGRGEACGVPYAGDTPETMLAELERVRPAVEGGIDRTSLSELLGPGGVRFALDSALWDLEAKRGAGSPYERLGIATGPAEVAMTIGIRSLAAFEETARRLAGFRTLKVKVDAHDPLAQVQAVRRGAPNPRLIVDPNQAWTVAQLRDLAPAMHDLGVVLLEQPIPVGAEAGLDGYSCPISLCADELVSSEVDLPAALGRFQCINIKLDKCGGLTAGVALAKAVREKGLSIMVGCMHGSSLAMAPAMVLGQIADFSDLDGPLLQSDDVEDGYVYVDGRVEDAYRPVLWG
jgi:L-alanine-DL-glutamate epimerase-like enolase superfamily enzyme